MVEAISNFLSAAIGFLWGTPLIVLVLGSGALFTVGTGFFQFRHFGHFFKETFGALFDKSQNDKGSGHVSAFQAAATAVGGAVGVGNIGSVATAIAVGGPGALFWLWIAALLGMALKCAEVSLACYYRSYDENGEPYGGPTYYISKGLGQLLPKGMKLPLILAAIFGIGFSCNWLSGVQAYTITEGFCSAFDLPLIAFGVFYCIVVWIIVLGGGKRVVEFASKVVPFMIILFVLAGLGIVVMNISEIPAALALIVKSAFSAPLRLAVLPGASVSLAIQTGIARSVFSNEAGQGSSTMVHSQAHTNHPVRQGLWGMFEVFMDTMVVCTIMSLAIILSGVWDSGVQGAALSVSAFGSVYGSIGAKLVGIAILLFGLTTQAGWFCYYDVLLRYFLKDNITLKDKILKFFRYLYPVPGLLTILYTVSNGLPTGFVWQITDFFCAVPTMLNIICVLCLSGVYFKLVKDYKARYMGIGKVDPNFKPFFEDEVQQ